MNHDKHFHSISKGFHHAFAHVAITLLAVGIAFSLPVVAKYILYYLWPRIEDSSRLLLFTEISFATALVLLFNISMIAWDGRRSMRLIKIASLVHAREGRGWMSRWKQRIMRKKIASVRDVYIMSISGYDTFSSENNDLQKTLDLAYEIRVLLANPYGKGIACRAQSMEDPAAKLQDYRQKTEKSIAYLSKLAAAGKKVKLKFYDEPPFWKLVVTGDYVWVQYCNNGHEGNNQPEYVFGLQHDTPQRGFFEPFYKHFLDQWNDTRQPLFNFETSELIYRNADGNEIERTAFPPTSLGEATLSRCATRMELIESQATA
ncbi:MAG TPA: hypothetical protein VMV48_14340 [Gallionellaceae bacterium]|nr:hypothetical protein [Gallionellaceae bacterium]